MIKKFDEFINEANSYRHIGDCKVAKDIVDFYTDKKTIAKYAKQFNIDERVAKDVLEFYAGPVDRFCEENGNSDDKWFAMYMDWLHTYEFAKNELERTIKDTAELSKINFDILERDLYEEIHSKFGKFYPNAKY